MASKKIKKPSQKTLKAKADKLAGAWFRTDARCVASGFFKHKCSRRIEWAHIKSRGILCVRHSPFNALPLCNLCHREFTMNVDRFTYFVSEWFPGRWEFLNERIQEAVVNHEKPDYEYWINWYSTRPKGENWAKWFRSGSKL